MGGSNAVMSRGRRYMRRAWGMLALILALSVAGCAGGSGESNAGGTPALLTPAPVDFGPVGRAALPAINSPGPFPIATPGQIYSTLHGVKQISSLLTRDADDYLEGYSQHVGGPLPPQLIFGPQWADGYSAFDTVAFAVYRFDLTARQGKLSINTQWAKAPGDYKLLWLGASNWQRDRWDWHSGAPSGVAQTADGGMDIYRHPETGEMYVAVLLLGQATATLRKVWLTCSQRGDWWMYGRDATHQARSPFKGPDHPALVWQQLLEPIGLLSWSNVVYDADGVLYWTLTRQPIAEPVLYALSPDGSEKWRYMLDSVQRAGCPAIADDGTIYVAQLGGALYAFTPSGAVKWQFTGRNNLTGMVAPNPTIGSGGDIYVTGPQEGTVRDSYLYAVKPDGTLHWEHYFDGYEVTVDPAVGSDGTVYCSCDDGRLYAFDAAGAVRWTYDAGMGNSSMRTPAVGNNGLVYFADFTPAVNAVGPDGALVWTCPLPDSAAGHLALNPDGVVYVPCRDKRLYAINSAGAVLWSYYIAGSLDQVSLDSEGTVYTGSSDGRLYALDSTGALKWWFTAPDGIVSTPAIGEDGTLYAASASGDLYAIGPGSQLAGYTASGYVTDSGGVGLPGVTMTITGEEPVVTDSQGRWSRSGLTPGEYLVAPTKAGYSFAPALAPVSVGEGDVAVPVFTGSALAPAIWPQWGGNSRHTRRSSHTGPALPDVRWSTRFSGERFFTEPCIDSAGVAYFQGSFGLYAFEPDGALRWSNLYFPGAGQAPVLGPDGTVYSTSHGKSRMLIAFTPGGGYKWSIAEEATSHPVFQPDGTILLYCFAEGLETIALDGTIQGMIEGQADDATAPAVGDDGTIYAFRLREGGVLACALNPDGSEQWARAVVPPGFGEESLCAAVGDDGTVYFGVQTRIYAFSHDGVQQWVYQIDGDLCLAPAIGPDGAVYTSVNDNDDNTNNKLLALNADGSLRWEYYFEEFGTQPPTLDAAGTVYACQDEWGIVYAINPDGSLKWSFADPWATCGPVAIGPDGTLYVADNAGGIYALGPGTP